MELENLAQTCISQTDFNTNLARKRLPPGQYDQRHYSRRALPLTRLIMTFTFFLVPRCYIEIKTIISCRARCPWPINHDVTCQTFHGSTGSEKTWHRCVFYKLVKSLSSTSLCYESVHRNHTGTIGHCEVTIAGGQLLHRWRHNRSTFWIIGSSDGIKCGFTSIKPQESHIWSVHWIHWC